MKARNIIDGKDKYLIFIKKLNKKKTILLPEVKYYCSEKYNIQTNYQSFTMQLKLLKNLALINIKRIYENYLCERGDSELIKCYFTINDRKLKFIIPNYI